MHHLKRLFGRRSSESEPGKQTLTARDILENPEKFPTDAIMWAIITTNIASYLTDRISRKSSLQNPNQTFQMVLDSENDGLSQALFVTGGSFDFQYTDTATSIEGNIQLGLIKGNSCGTRWAGADHPFFSITLREKGLDKLKYIFHYMDDVWQLYLGGPWEYQYLVDSWIFKTKPDGHINPPQAQYGLALAVGSPFTEFLNSFEQPQWHESGYENFPVLPV